MSRRTIVVIAASSVILLAAVFMFIFNVGNIRRSFASSNPKIDAQWTIISNDGKTFRVQLGVRTTTASKNLGPATFIFKFNADNMSFHSGGSLGTLNTDYFWATGFGNKTNSSYGVTSKVTQPEKGKIYIVMDFNGGTGSSITNTSAFVPVIDIVFTTLNPLGLANITWAMNESNPPTLDDVFDDKFSAYDMGTFTGITATPLPVTLVSFNAELKNKETDITWATSSEINNAFFTVERSQDGVHFSELLTKPGAGNSNKHIDYEAFDEHPLHGISYYRLKQTDYNGKSETFKMVAIDNKDQGEFEIVSINPTSFKDFTTMNYKMPSDGDVKVVVTNTGGKTIMDIPVPSHFGENTYRFDNAATWEPGLYIVSIYFDGRKASSKMIKL